MLAAIPAQIAIMNCNAQTEVSASSLELGVRMLMIAVVHIAIEGHAAYPNLPPDSDRIRVDISLSSTQLHTALAAQQIYGRMWKQQLAVPHEREANLVYIQSAISSPLKP